MKTYLRTKLLETVFTAFREAAMTDERSLLLVSGGVDSMTLLMLMKKLVTMGRIQPFEVLHCQYNLRPDAYLDTELITKVCAEREIPLTVAKQDFLKLQRDRQQASTVNIQGAARNFRYEVGRKLLREKNLGCLVTAHHGDDVVETFLWKLGEAKSLEALASSHEFSNVILRPLLSVWKSDISAYAQAAGVGYREDSSNEELTYLRNVIRHRLVKEFQEVFPQFKPAVFTVLARWKTLLTLQEKLVVHTQLARRVGEVILLGEQFFINPNSEVANHLRLSPAEKMQILHSLFLKSYPQRRFSSGELLAIFKKLGTGVGRKDLFTAAPYGTVVYSRGLIAPLPLAGHKMEDGSVGATLRIGSEWKSLGPYGKLALVPEGDIRLANSLANSHTNSHIHGEVVESVSEWTHAKAGRLPILEVIRVVEVEKGGVIPELICSPLAEQTFKVRGHEVLGKTFLKKAKIPYPICCDSWTIELTLTYPSPPRDSPPSSTKPSVKPQAAKSWSNNAKNSHPPYSLNKKDLPTPIKIGICSPFALWLASQSDFSHRFTPTFLVYDDDWKDWNPQQLAKQSQNNSTNRINNQTNNQLITNWYLIWESSV